MKAYRAWNNASVEAYSTIVFAENLPSLHVVMACLCFSSLSFSLPFPASTTLLTPLPCPK